MAKLLVFSGLDCAGKSTQINLLMDKLRQNGFQPVYLWSRGGYTPGFQGFKNLLRRLSGHKAVPKAGPSTQRTQAFQSRRTRRIWLNLALLDLIWIYGVQVRLWRRQDKVIVCDRYLGDTLIDFRLNFPQENIESWLLWRLLAKVTPRPDAAFLMFIPVEESLRRSEQKGEPFPDSPEVLAKRLAEYEILVGQGQWQALDGLRPVDEIARTIQEQIGLLSNSGKTAVG